MWTEPARLALRINMFTFFYLPIHDSTVLLLDTIGRTSWTGDQPVGRPLPTHRTTQTQNKRAQTSMPWVGFEPTVPVLERAKTAYATRDNMVSTSRGKATNIASRNRYAALDLTVTVIGSPFCQAVVIKKRPLIVQVFGRLKVCCWSAVGKHWAGRSGFDSLPDELRGLPNVCRKLSLKMKWQNLYSHPSVSWSGITSVLPQLRVFQFMGSYNGSF
jgi:hypothetical protein